MKKKSIRHHFIPQFILRNFLNYNDKLDYYDKINDLVVEELTSNVFMEKNLNFDVLNHPENPLWIEEELSFFESDIAPLIKKLNNDDEIVLLKEEVFKLRLFLFIMMFRSKHVRNEFLKFNNHDLELYKLFQDFDNSEDLWKKNLSELLKCKNETDLKKFKNINPIILNKCLYNIINYYTTVIEKRGSTGFIMSDVYPVVYYRNIYQKEFPVCLLCPISPYRMLVLNFMENDKIFKNDNVITKNFSYPPQPFDRKNYSIKLIVKKVYEKEVKEINKIIYESAIEGVIMTKNE